jgi:heme exporter protein A
VLAALRLEVEDLAVERAGTRIFSGVSFRAGPGDYVELTGPNGAGKTSLLRTLAGLMRPAEGRISLSSNLGPIDQDERALATHLLSHQDGLKPTLDVRDHVQYWRGLLGGGDALAVLASAGLGRLSDRQTRTLSAGQKRRLALCRLLIAPRPLWLLDEPGAALDLAGRAWLLGVVGDHLAAGGMVVAAVHEPIGATPAVRVALEAPR